MLKTKVMVARHNFLIKQLMYIITSENNLVSVYTNIKLVAVPGKS